MTGRSCVNYGKQLVLDTICLLHNFYILRFYLTFCMKIGAKNDKRGEDFGRAKY